MLAFCRVRDALHAAQALRHRPLEGRELLEPILPVWRPSVALQDLGKERVIYDNTTEDGGRLGTFRDWSWSMLLAKFADLALQLYLAVVQLLGALCQLALANGQLGETRVVFSVLRGVMFLCVGHALQHGHDECHLVLARHLKHSKPPDNMHLTLQPS